MALAAESAPAAPLRMLWLGSSSTYYHDLPRQLADWLERGGAFPTVLPSLAGKSGTGVQRYLESGFRLEYGVHPNQTVLDKIREEKPRFVVLQVPVNFLAGGGTGNDSNAFKSALEVYTQTARETGGKVLFYEMGWGTGEDFTTGDKMLQEAAARHKAPIVPCRTAWNRVRAERPDLELHNLPDRSHPGTLGCYLNLCCFYAALSGKPPAGVPKDIRIWRPPKTDQAKAEADTLVAAATLNAYQQQLAGWMKRNSVSAKLERIEPAVAEYLQQVAWETWLGMGQESPTGK